jgi:hypothetical protein
MGPSNPARRLNIFRDIRGEPREEHGIELVDVDTVANGRRGHDVSKTLAKRQKCLTWLRPAFRALHDLLDFGDRNPTRDQVSNERQISYTFSPLIPLDLVLQRFNNLVSSLLVCHIGQGDAQKIEERRQIIRAASNGHKRAMRQHGEA